MNMQDKVELEVRTEENAEITDLTFEEAAKVQGGFWWLFFPSKKTPYATGNRRASTTTYRG